MNIIDKIKSHDNNDPVEIVKIILENDFDVSKGLVYLIDDSTILKRMHLMCDPHDAVNRVNAVVPNFIKSYNIVSETQIELYLTRYNGRHPYSKGVVKNKEHAIEILNACLAFTKKASPYTMNDFCSGNILVDNDIVHIVDLDQIFNNDDDTTPLPDYYRKMNWLHEYVDYEEFLEIWTK